MWFSERTQHPRLSIAHGRNLEKTLDQGKECGAMLADLSKTCDCLLHDLIAAKLHTFGFSLESVKLINSYLTNR